MSEVGQIQRRFGQRLKQLRREAGLRQHQLAARLQPPVSKETISRYERGHRSPSMRQIGQLGEALGIDVVELWRGAGDPAPTFAPPELIDILVLLESLSGEHLRAAKRLVQAYVEGVGLERRARSRRAKSAE